MNECIKEFLGHKIICPLCCKELKTCLSSKSISYNKIENDRFLIFKQLKPLYSLKPIYWSAYSFGKDNTFNIEFYDNALNKMDEVSLSTISMFKDMNKNIGTYDKEHVLIRYCDKCGGYNYRSSLFSFDFTNQTHTPFTISKEFIGLSKYIEKSKYKLYKIVNDFDSSQTTINYTTVSTCPDFSKWDLMSNWYLSGGIMDIPIIEFVGKDSILDKIDLLITFS